jgi:hypothetical protein
VVGREVPQGGIRPVPKVAPEYSTLGFRATTARARRRPTLFRHKNRPIHALGCDGSSVVRLEARADRCVFVLPH